MPVHSPAPPKQATIALSYASSWSSTTQTSNYSSQLCQLIVQHHPNKQLQLSVMPAHSPAPPKQATIALSYASSQSSTTQTSNYSSQLCQLIVQHHPNRQLYLSVMPAHSQAPSKQATKALSYASSQSRTTQTSNYSSQSCQLIVQHNPNKQIQLSVMQARSPVPPNQATIALCYASSQSSTTQTSNHSSQFCQLTVKHHPNKQPQLSVMPAHSPAPLKQQPQLSVMPVHSLAPLKQATIALRYASSQSSTTQTSNYSSQLCQFIVQHHPNKQLQLSVMPAHSPAPPKQATIALSYASPYSSTTQTSNHSSQLCQLIVQHHPNKQPKLSVLQARSPAPPKQATIALSYASSQSTTIQTSNYSSQLCQFVVQNHQTSNQSSQVCQRIVQHHPNKQLQLSVMPAHSPAPSKQATKALSYASSQSSTIQTSNYSSQLGQLIVQNHQKHATIALSYASSQSSTTQTSNYSSQLCQLIVKHHPNKQPQLSVMPAHSPAPPQKVTIALSYACSQTSTTQTSNYIAQLCQLIVQHHPNSKYSSQLCQLIVQHHPNKQPQSELCLLIVQHHSNKQLQLSVMRAHGPTPPKQATIALSYASSQSSTPKQATIALSYASSESSTTQTSNYSSQLCQLIDQHHPNKQLQLSVMPAHSPAPPNQATIALTMPAHSPAPPKHATIALSYASSQSSTTQTSNYSSQLCQPIVQHHPKQATIALSYASSYSSTTQTSNLSSQLCQLIVQHNSNNNHSSQLCQFIVQHHSNKQLQLSVMTVHSLAPLKQATISLSYASSQSSSTQTSNYSSQLCQLMVQHQTNKQLQLFVMPANKPAPPKQATIALSYASSWSSTKQTSNYSSLLCQLIDQHHPNKQLQLSVMPADSPAPSKQLLQLSVMPAHSPVPLKQATIALSHASSQSSNTQTSKYSSQLCQLIVQHHPNKQPKLSVMPAHSLAPSKQATIALSQASSQSSTTKNMQPQLSVMPAHSPAPPKQATIALSYASSQSSTTQSSNHSSHYASSQSSTTQTRNYSSQLCQLIVQHHPNKQLQLSVMPAHSQAPSKQATKALSYASSQSRTTQTSNYSSQSCQLIVQHNPNKQIQLSVMQAHSPVPPNQATIALCYASSQSSTTQTSNHSSQFCQLTVKHHPNKQPQLSVMPAHSPAQLKQQPQLSVMPVHSLAPLKQATIALSYDSSQSSTTQTSNYISQLCQFIVQLHPNKQLQLSVMPAHGPAPNKQATIALCYAS